MLEELTKLLSEANKLGWATVINKGSVTLKKDGHIYLFSKNDYGYTLCTSHGVMTLEDMLLFKEIMVWLNRNRKQDLRDVMKDKIEGLIKLIGALTKTTAICDGYPGIYLHIIFENSYGEAFRLNQLWNETYEVVFSNMRNVNRETLFKIHELAKQLEVNCKSWE